MEKEIYNGVEILHFGCVDSTNTVAMEYKDKRHMLTVVSDIQTSGRGRMGHDFFSYNGGLYMSVILDPSKIKIPYNLCTPSAAIAVKRSLNKYCSNEIKIKWVNDLYIGTKKICGILSESRIINGKVERIVIGIGVNLLNKEPFPHNIAEKAGYVGCNTDKMTLCAEIVKNIGSIILQNKDLIVQEYSNNLAFTGETVNVTDYTNDNSKIKGKILGVNDDCFLILQLSDSSTKIISSGEIINI